MNDKKKVTKAKPNRRGAPNKREDKKILKNHLRQDQQDRLTLEADSRGVSMWKFARQCIDFAIDAMDSKERSDKANAMLSIAEEEEKELQ